MPELWDLYDGHRNPLHITHVRGSRLKRGTYHIAVGIWTVNERNEILLTLRSPEKKDWPNLWENTAGSVLAGETSREGAVRELREETGIQVTEEELYLLGTETGRNTIGDCYMVRKNIPLEQVVCQQGETCDARWVTVEELDRMIAQGLVAPPVSGRLGRIRKRFEDFLYGRIGTDRTDPHMKTIPFGPADILLPKGGFDKWSVVACDQYTSQPEYWEELDRQVGDAPSTLRITLPEVYLESPDVAGRIEAINATMKRYLEEGLFREYKDAMVFVERTLADGRTRRGIVGAVDLTAYDYNVGSTSPIRATEGTVLSRIPPRVAIRKDAPLELPHIMILIDDPENTVVPASPDGEILYDTDLLMNGGHIRGSLMSQGAVDHALARLAEQGKARALLFAMGDGNHSLATAKACYDESNPLSRYALAEIVNIHDPALDFEPIYRVVFGVDPEALLAEAKARFAGATEHPVTCVYGDKTDAFSVDGLAAGTLQQFIDDYLSRHPEASVDYIHGEDTVRELASKENAVGFLFDGIRKDELFPYVDAYGALPRKTFSMGEAHDKRFYMECRKIK